MLFVCTLNVKGVWHAHSPLKHRCLKFKNLLSIIEWVTECIQKLQGIGMLFNSEHIAAKRIKL